MARSAVVEIVAVPSMVELRCDMCGEHGQVSREVSDLKALVARWAGSHRMPRIVAVTMVAEHGGRPLGTWRCRA